MDLAACTLSRGQARCDSLAAAALRLILAVMQQDVCKRNADAAACQCHFYCSSPAVGVSVHKVRKGRQACCTLQQLIMWVKPCLYNLGESRQDVEQRLRWA